MQKVGFQFNCSMTADPRGRHTPSIINRAVLIDHYLRECGSRVFFYSPAQVTPSGTDIPGYLIEDGLFVPTRSEIPAVNGNWTRNTRKLLEKGMGYRAFARWAEARGIGIYVPHAFSDLINDKLETYKLVRGFHPTLHPHCEAYRHSKRQLEHFIENSSTTFIKPQKGNQGDHIITVRRDEKGLSVTRYKDRRQKVCNASSLPVAMEFIQLLMGDKQSFVIQHGVDTMRLDGSVFDIRVVMLHDGDRWHWISEVRLSRKGSDVSNVGQGGSDFATEDLLFDLLGHESSQLLLTELKSESFALAAYLERLHPGEILEVAFDFAIEREGALRLLEINTKPGLTSVGSGTMIHDKGPDDEARFRDDVYPYMRHLAGFLRSKLECIAR